MKKCEYHIHISVYIISVLLWILATVLWVPLLTGCARPIHLHPIQTVDIIPIRKGETLKAPKDGFFLSDLYLRHVAKSKVIE